MCAHQRLGSETSIAAILIAKASRLRSESLIDALLIAKASRLRSESLIDALLIAKASRLRSESLIAAFDSQGFKTQIRVFDSSSIDSQGFNLSSGGKLRLLSDCVHVQTDLNLSCTSTTAESKEKI